MKLETIIGLEIHLQLKTKTKMFCACANSGEGLSPNTAICPVCTGQPGALPVPNNQALAWAVRTALAFNSKINTISKFDRKHYFYPDLPKGYQISQYDLPIALGGGIEVETEDENGQPLTRKIRLVRVHAEEDAAKLLHGDAGHSYVDFNRSGAPLIEIVTQPDIKTPAEAKTFLQELQIMARYLGVSHAEMEKGQMRCDVNISLRQVGETQFYPKTEIKNVNSFKAVERALEYEIQRQTKLWHDGNAPAITTTRGWNDAKQITEEQRSKEDAADYRYFPEPDIPPFDLSAFVEEEQKHLPEMPAKRRARFVEEFDLSSSDARILTADPAWSDFTEHVFTECWEWLTALPELEGSDEEIMKKQSRKVGRMMGGWLTSKLMGLMAENKIDIRVLKITPENFAEFISIIYTNKINSANATLLLQEMLLTGGDPSQIMEEKKLGQVSDANWLAKAVETVIRLNPEQVTQYQAGKTVLIQFLVGKVMKETQGQADPQAARKALEEKLK